MKVLFLIFFGLSNLALACQDVSGIYQFRSHFMKLAQTGCESLDMATKNYNSATIEIIHLAFDNLMTPTDAVTIDNQGRVIARHRVNVQSTFDERGFPTYLIDDPQSFDVITKSLIELRGYGSQIIQTNAYISRQSGKVIHTQSLYGVRK